MKYHSKKIKTEDGIFDSQKEYYRWLYLKEDNTISNLQRQVKYELIPKIDKQRAVHYIADFVYTINSTGETIVEDSKGFKTAEYKLKKKLMKWLYGVDIYES